MDLLEGIEDASADFNSVLAVDYSHDDSSNSGSEIDVDAISRRLPGGASQVLNKIKKRLMTKENTQPEDPNQSDDDLSGPSIFNFASTQNLPQLEVDEEDFVDKTQKLPVTQKVSPPIEQTQANTQVETQQVETQQMETQQGETQPVETQAIATLTYPNETQPVEPVTQPVDKSNATTQNTPAHSKVTQKIASPGEETREEKIARLIEEKKRRRLEQEQELAADVSHVTLTDEENDINEADVSVSADNYKDGIVSKKDLEEAEQFINIQKRSKDIRPQFEKQVVFTKDRLLAAFEDSDESEVEEVPTKSTPATSPVKTVEEPTQTKRPNPLEKYAHNLKLNLAESNLIDLESEEEEEIPSSFKPPTAKVKQDLPEMSKEQKLLIKQKFSKKKMQGKTSATPKVGNTFLAGLRKAHVEQLKAHRLANPHHELMEEIEKEEEIMGSLLEREMERARNIRKKEKLREKAKAALLSQGKGGDKSETVQNVPESEVEESEVAESDYSSDSEEDEEASASEEEAEPIKRTDDSYMFGGAVDESFDHDDDMVTTTLSQQRALPVMPVINDSQDPSYQLFQNLKPRSTHRTPQAPPTQVHGQLPVFEDIKPSQEPTQADMVEVSSTRVVSESQPTQADDDSDDEDDIKRTKGKRGIVLGDISEEEGETDPAKEKQEDEGEKKEEDDEGEVEEIDPEEAQRRIKEYEQKIRRKELKERKRRKALERKGVKDIVDGEAEESEDEWKGLGGEDGDVSDQANSDDEKMIDNDFRIDLKNEEVRKKFMDDYQIKDQKELEKLLDDVKNHRLTKKVARNGFDVELSDEEDELLAAYRKQRFAEQQLRLMQNKKVHDLAQNDKTKAFFSSMQEENSVIRLDSDEEDEEEETQEPNETEPVQQKLLQPKKIKVDEAYIQKQLSFLTSVNDDEDQYMRVQALSNIQHGVESDDDVDIEAFKSLCVSRMTSMRSETPEELKKRAHDEDTDADDETDEDIMPVFKKPSFIQSFRSFHEQQGVQVKEGKRFSGVVVSNQYRVASGSKASITYASKTALLLRQLKSTKERKLERSVNLAKQHSKKLFSASGEFDELNA